MTVRVCTPVWETQIEGLNGKAGRKWCSRRPEQSQRLPNEGIWVREGRQGSFSRGYLAGFHPQGAHVEARRRDSLRSDDGTTAASWNSRSSTTETEKGHAIRGNWNLKKESDLAGEVEAKKKREDVRRASAAKVQDIRGKSSWRSRGTSDEDKADMSGLVERAGNAGGRE
jgi:hypothetical protein